MHDFFVFFLTTINKTGVLFTCLVVFLSVTITCLTIIFFKPEKFLFNERANTDLTAVQRAHVKSVSRIGGMALIPGLVSLLILFDFYNITTDFTELFYITVLPIFLIGISEDIGFYMTACRRLTSICLSSSLVVITLGIWIDHVGVPLIDSIISIPIFGIAFTIFAVTGAVNSFNLIDGLNGLSSITAMSIAGALFILSAHQGNSEIAILLIAFVSMIMGFFVLNFPFGKIFLGDAGAYMMGHIVTWLAIYLMKTNTSISAFSVLLIFFWPIADSLLAIWRRTFKGRAQFQPDRLHYHQLVMRFIEIKYLGRSKRNVSNPLTTVILIPFIITPQILGILFYNSDILCFLVLVIVAIVYVSIYRILIAQAKL